MKRTSSKESYLFAFVCFLVTVSCILIFLMLSKAPANSWQWGMPPFAGISVFIIGYLAWSRLVAGRNEDRARRSVYAGCIVGVATHFVHSAIWGLVWVAASLFTNQSWLEKDAPLIINIGTVAAIIIRAAAVMGIFSLVITGIFTIPLGIFVARLFAAISPSDKVGKQELETDSVPAVIGTLPPAQEKYMSIRVRGLLLFIGAGIIFAFTNVSLGMLIVLGGLALAGLIQFFSGVPLSELGDKSGDKWNTLAGWQRGVYGTLIFFAALAVILGLPMLFLILMYRI